MDLTIKYLQEQLSNEEAYQRLIKTHHEYIGDEDESLFWYALADTQWRLGRLTPEVKEKALEWIEKGGGLELWEESTKGGAGWEKTLLKLKTILESPMPPEKIIKKPIEFIRNPWNIGDVYAYQFHSTISKDLGLFGKYISFQKIADEEWCDGWIFSRVQIYDKIFDKLPTLQDLDGVRILPFDKPDLFITGERDTDSSPLCLNAVMIRYSKRDYTEKHFRFIGNQPDRAHFPFAHPNLSNFSWKNIDTEFLCEYYQAWRGYEYEIIDEKSYVRLK